MSRFSGFDPVKSLWRLNIHRVSFLIMEAVALIMTFYSIFNEWPVKTEIFKVSMGVGIFTQTIVKGFLIIHNRDTFEKLIDDIKEMYEKLEKAGKKRKAILEKCIRNCDILFKILFVVDTSAVVIFFAYPVISLCFFNERYLMLPFYSPLIDRHSDIGFVVNSILHGVLLVYTLLLHNSFDSIFAIFVLQVTAKVELLKIDLEEFKAYLLIADTDKLEVQKQIGKKYRSIIVLQENLDAYINYLSDFYSIPCFITVSTSVFSICIALILMLIVNWVLAYGLTWALSGQLFAYFVFGTVVQNQIQALNAEIWNFPWYLLKVQEQKTLCLMILQTQRPLKLEMIFIGPLNMETFSNVSDLNFLRTENLNLFYSLHRLLMPYIRTT